jgi:hypothetical protein
MINLIQDYSPLISLASLHESFINNGEVIFWFLAVTIFVISFIYYQHPGSFPLDCQYASEDIELVFSSLLLLFFKGEKISRLH